MLEKLLSDGPVRPGCPGPIGAPSTGSTRSVASERRARQPSTFVVALLGVAVFVAAACGGGSESATPPVPVSEPADGAVVGSSPPAPSTTPACRPAPVEERAATVVAVGIGEGRSADDPVAAEVAALGVGAVTLRPPNIVDAAQVGELIAGLRDRSPRPLLVGVDEEGGRVSRLRTILGASPSPRTLAQRPLDQIADHAAERATRVRELGFDLTFAPVVDADGGPASGPIGDRSFSADVPAAGEAAAAYAAGLDRAGLLAAAKHFPGQGDLTDDSHAGSVVADVTAEQVEASAAGFRPLIEAGVPAVMLSHATFPAVGPLPASVEPAAYELLRDHGFDGVAVTDSLGMGAIVQRWSIPDAAVMALVAGADLALANQGDQATAMRDAVVAAVADGRLPEARLDEAVARVLRLQGEDPATMVCP